MASIRNVEIFRTGVWNGDSYDSKDLDDIIAAHKEIDFRPCVKIGHTKDAPGAPAFGWVKNLRRIGEKLIADFTDMDDSVVDAIRRKSYDNVSSEIYFNLKRGGRIFRRALKAVALLGVEPPAVADLKPLHRMEFGAADQFDSIFAFTNGLAVDADDPGAELDRQAKALMREGRIASYSAAVAVVLQENRPLAAEYAARGVRKYSSEAGADLADPIDSQVHREVLKWIGSHPGMRYSVALEQLLDARPELKAAYKNWRPSR